MRHEHLIVRAETNRTIDNLFDDLEHAFVRMIDDLNMKIVRGPDLWYCTDPKENEGWTVSAIINTSHVVLHTWTGTRVAQLDIYTCGELRMQPMIDFFLRLGGTSSLMYKWLDREKGLLLVKEGHVGY